MAVVTIIGGHGKVALLAEPLLVERGHTVNALIRRPEQSEDIVTRGANPVVTDITALSTEEMAKLLTELGTEALVWSAGAGGVGGPERTYAVDRDAAIRSMDAARLAGIKRYVMVSYLGAGSGHGIDPDNSFYAYAESKAIADEHLRGSGLDYTILGPGMLTLEEAGGITLGVEPAHTPGAESNTPRATVAQVLAAVLEDPSTVGKALPFIGGPTPIAQALASAPNSNKLR